MSEVIERVGKAVCETEADPYQRCEMQLGKAALYALTAGDRWRDPNGNEVVVVRIDVLETVRDNIADGYEDEAWRCLAAITYAKQK